MTIAHNFESRALSAAATSSISGRAKRGAWIFALLLGTAASASATTLDVGDGVVVKFGANAGLVVNDGLHTGRDVVFTSVKDDTLGQTGAVPATPPAAPGDWSGVKIERTVAANSLQVDRLAIRFAGANGGAGLELAGNYEISFLQVLQSTVGLRVIEAAAPLLHGISLLSNGVGLEVRDTAKPSVDHSEIRGNTLYGVDNLSTLQTVAEYVWWGAASGPNPPGAGDELYGDVDYTPYGTILPLIDCSIRTANGNTTVGTPDVNLVLSCRNAGEFRLSEDAAFTGAVFQPIPQASTVDFTLSPGAGTKTIHAQFKSVDGDIGVDPIMLQITYAPGIPVVTIAEPSNGAVISADTTIKANIDAASVAGTSVTAVQFFADGISIGNGSANGLQYQKAWSITGVTDDSHVLKAVATTANGQSGEAWITVTVSHPPADSSGPVIEHIRFAGSGTDLHDGDTLTATTPGLLTFDVSDPSGVATADVTVDGAIIGGGGLHNGHYSVMLDFSALGTAPHTIVVHAMDNADAHNATSVILGLVVNIPAPPPPAILVPTSGTQAQQRSIAVSGTAQPSSTVQLYLDGSPAGNSFVTAFNGAFMATVTLPELEEHDYALTAKATNTWGTSGSSAAVTVSYKVPAPSVSITSPPAGAEFMAGAEVTISAAVIDALGVDTVTATIDGQPIGQPLHAPPFDWTWTVTPAIAAQPSHEIAITAVNVAGKSASATRTIATYPIPPVQPPQTPYTGQVDSITPASSFGEQPIFINGSAVDTTTGAAVPNALLKIVLQVNGFQRRIGTATDATGHYSFRFVPQSSDAGNYVVSVIHPDQSDLPNLGNFTINRLALPSTYTLQAARTVRTKVTITAKASAGSGASGVHLDALPADQTSTGLPPGITIEPSSVVNIGAGQSVPIDVFFTATNEAEPAGTVVLTATDGSGNARGKVAIFYSLSAPLPALYPQPSSVQTGVARGHQVNESVLLTNRGLAPATNVHVGLAEFSALQNGQYVPAPVPTWISLASPADLGNIAVGASTAVQILAAPIAGVDDGIYTIKITVNADGGISGYVWVSIAVTSSETGGALLHAKDIYTCVGGCEAAPGLAGASITVQNEQVPTIVQRGTTNSGGTVEFTNLPVGHYRYVANAPQHVGTTGRLTVRPLVSVVQDVFLDYELVTFEWSVTETTIQDQYDVTITASYITQVPAPVVLIEPASINLPDMQTGEELIGEITITNYGLVRADNVTWTPAHSDDYFLYEYFATPPESLDAHQKVHIPYRVTKRAPLQGMDGQAAVPTGASFLSVKAGAKSTAGTCYSYHNPMASTFGYMCAAGDQRSGSAHSGFNKAWGQCGGGAGGAGGSPGGGGAGGWLGGGGGGPIGTPMTGGPGCVPICPDCNGGGPGG